LDGEETRVENRKGVVLEVQTALLIRETEKSYQVMQVKSILDTGSEVSLMSRKFLEAAGLKMRPKEQLKLTERIEIGTVTDGDLPYLGCVYPWLMVGNRKARVRLYVVDFLDHGLLLGTDTMPCFGLGIGGLSLRTPIEFLREAADQKKEGKKLPKSKDEWQKKFDSLKGLGGADLELFMSLVQPALDRNGQLPSNTSCSLPESVISIPTGDAKPIYVKQFPIAREHQAEFEQHAQGLLKEGITKEAKYNVGWNFAMFNVKQNGKNRWVLNLKPLNAVITTPLWSTPSVDEILQFAMRFVLVTKLDLKRGYYQFSVNLLDQDKLTFTCNGRRYSFTRAAFGLKHMPCIFQSVSELLLRSLPKKEGRAAGNFIDDILVFTLRLGYEESWDDVIRRHGIDVVGVVDLLTQHKLLLNIEKCKFAKQQAILLGMLCEDGKVSPDPAKIEALSLIPRPTTAHQVLALMGTINYNRKFVALYSTLLAPIEALRSVKRITSEEWSHPCEQAFTSVLHILNNAPYICAPNWDEPFGVATDASNVGIAGVCFQGDYSDPESIRIIAFTSRALHAAERNYSTPQKELLAIMVSLQKFREYVGLVRFKLYTDHRAHTFLLSKRDNHDMIGRWWLVIMQFDMEIIHCPGIKNTLPDSLSRLYPEYTWERGESDVETTHFVEKKQKSLEDCKEKVNRMKVWEKNDMEEEKAVHIFGKKLVAKDDVKKELERVHIQGHYGAEYLVNALWSEDLYWPEMYPDACEFVRKCLPCLRWNVLRRGFNPQKSILAKYPLDHIAIDLCSFDITSPRGYNYVLVVVDVATRFVFLEPLKNKEAVTVAWKLWKMWCRAGFPKVIQHDNGKEFVNQLLGTLATEVGVDQRCVSAYYPQANGLAEAHVKLAKTVLLKRVEGNIANFDRYLPAIERDLNMRWASDTKTRPFELFNARPVNHFQEYRGVEIKMETEQENLERNNEIMETVFETLAAAVAAKRRKRDENATKRRGKAADFDIGDKVMLEDKTRGAKTNPIMEGPYLLVERNEGGAFRVKKGEEILSRWFTVNQMKMVEKKADPNEEKEFVIKEILDVKGPEGKREYLVKWVGYGESENSWEPPEMFSSELMIKRFWAKRAEQERKGIEVKAIVMPVVNEDEVDEKKNVVEDAEWVFERITDCRVTGGNKPMKMYKVKWKGMPLPVWTEGFHCETDPLLAPFTAQYRADYLQKCERMDEKLEQLLKKKGERKAKKG
jgi:transposase InsO family protein